MPTEMGVAVFGTGSAGMHHLDALLRLPAVRPIALPTRQERVRELLDGGYRAAASVEEAIQTGVRACIIATDTGRHLSDALAVLAHGCDLLIEKPLTATADEGRRLLAHALQRRRQMFVGCVLRFSDSLNAFRAQLPQIGPLHRVRIVSQSYLPDWRPHRRYQDSYSARSEDGGVLRDLIHEIDYAGWLFGWPDRVHAVLSNFGRLGIATEELAELSWERSGGSVVTISLDYLTRPPRRGIVAYGERGTLEWDGMTQTVTLALAEQPATSWQSSQSREAMFQAQAAAFLQAIGPSRRLSDGVTPATDDVAGQMGADPVEHPPDPRLATASDGVKALAVCDAARRAAATGCAAPVEGIESP